MTSRFKPFVLAAAFAGWVAAAGAFSMMGPFAEWMVPRIGYNPPLSGEDMGGPMNLGEKYRWNVKTVYYAYDSSFLQYFGVQGTNAIEQAIAILNALPPVSQMSSNLSEYPLEVRRVNYQASALNLIDLKSFTLGHLLTHLGLASPERYTWTLRSRVEIVSPPPPVNYAVIKRNFDPVTLNPSSFVNGVLYTYVVQEFVGPWADATELQVDPLANDATSVVGMADDIFSSRILDYGEYVTGLTRDDVGGLRHLYGKSNPLEHWHVETLPTNTTAAAASSPWNPIGGTNAVATNNFVNQALRPGVEKVTFVRANYDSLLGQFVVFTNQWTDTYISNGVFRTQTVQRAVEQPDIVFTAEDLGVNDAGVPFFFSRSLTDGWSNNDAINGVSTLDGPGVINGPIQYAYSKVGPYYMNQSPFLMDETRTLFQGAIWGFFDGTTNPPVVFPSGSSLQNLKLQVIYAGSPWTIANSFASTNSAAAGGVVGTGN